MKTILASLIATVVLSTACTSAQAQPAATSSNAAQRASDQASGLAPGHWASARHIEGVWDEYITVVNCSSGAPMITFRATNLFASGGALTATNSNPPATSGPTLGTWWRVSRHGDFGAKMRFFRFNPDGSFAGIQEVTRAISVDPGSETLTGTVTFDVFDANDNLLQSGCATETGTRVS